MLGNGIRRPDLLRSATDGPWALALAAFFGAVGWMAAPPIPGSFAACYVGLGIASFLVLLLRQRVGGRWVDLLALLIPGSMGVMGARLEGGGFDLELWHMFQMISLFLGSAAGLSLASRRWIKPLDPSGFARPPGRSPKLLESPSCTHAPAWRDPY